MRWLALGLLALNLTAGPARAESIAPAECAEHPCIQVGSFNIRYLGQRERTAEQVDALADLVSEELDLEVFALQEIDTTSGQWAAFKERLAARGYRFLEGTTSERKQFVVLGWDGDEVQEVPGSAHPLPIPDAFSDPANPACHYEGLRVPIAVRLKAGEFDFWVVGVHQKSRWRGSLPYYCPAWIRERHTAALMAAIENLAAESGEYDVLVVGDFNADATDDSLAPLRRAGFTSQILDRMAGSGACSYLPGCPDLIDHVWLPAGDTRERVRHSGYVLPVPAAAEQEFIELRSDHAPVWASFRTDRDLD